MLTTRVDMHTYQAVHASLLLYSYKFLMLFGHDHSVHLSHAIHKTKIRSFINFINFILDMSSILPAKISNY